MRSGLTPNITKTKDELDGKEPTGHGDSAKLAILNPVNAEQLEDRTYELPMHLINLLEKSDNWRKRSLHGVKEKPAQKYYCKVHNDPKQYRNLYQYLVFR